MRIDPARELTSKAQALLLATDQERIAFIRSDHVVAYSEAQAVLVFIRDVLTFPAKVRQPYLFVGGDSNNGKSMIGAQIKAAFPGVYDDQNSIMTLPVLVITLPAETKLGALYCRLIAEIGATYRASSSNVKLYDQLFHLLRQHRVKVIVIDEINNLLSGEISPRGLQVIYNVLREFGATLGISVVALGLSSAHAALCNDRQLANRFIPHGLPLWFDEARTRQFLRAYEKFLPLRLASNLGERALAGRIARTAEFLLGEIVEVLQQAAVEAIRSGTEKIDEGVLDRIAYISPSKRRGALQDLRRGN